MNNGTTEIQLKKPIKIIYSDLPNMDYVDEPSINSMIYFKYILYSKFNFKHRLIIEVFSGITAKSATGSHVFPS